jgi:hypothetical protein
MQADAEHMGTLEKVGRWMTKMVKRSNTAQGFEDNGWFVEQSFARLSGWEQTIASAETWLLIVHISHITRMLMATLVQFVIRLSELLPVLWTPR